MNKYFSQHGQDKFLNEVLFKNKKQGVFLDIGANDGITFSNSYFFEKELGWTGTCFEPQKEAFLKLQSNRNSLNVKGCASDQTCIDVFYNVTGYGEMLSGLKSQYDPRHLERIKHTIAEHGGSIFETDIECYNINEFLINNKNYEIDFMSLDTEGGELKILKAIDFSIIKMKAVVIENNYGTNEILDFMQEQGFYRVAYLATDEIYINPKHYGLVKTILLKVKLKFQRVLGK